MTTQTFTQNHSRRIAILLTLNLLLCVISLQAQSWDEVVNDRQTWIFGEGRGISMEEAQQAAMADLTGKISTTVINSFDQIEDERTKNGEIDASTYIKSKVSTYSHATLSNTEHFEKEDGDEWLALRFIRRSEVNKIFEGRKTKVMELVRSGEEAESQYKVGDALKYYYWAFTLLKTMQYPNEVKYSDKQKVEHQLATYLPQKMDAIFDDIHATVTNYENDIAELYFTFRNHPVVNMEYSYYNGSSYSNIYNVKDGRGDVELLSNFIPEYLQIKIEYAYRQDAKMYCPEVKDVQEVVKSHSLRKATLSVPMKKKTLVFDNEQPTFGAMASTIDEVVTSSRQSALVELIDDAAYRSKADAFVRAMRANNPHSIDHLFTAEGLVMYNQLLKYGTPRIYGEPNYKVYQKGDEVVVRSIPMSFAFKQGARKSIIEDLVLSFDASGKIHWLSFALDKTAADDILTKGAWSDTVRQTILSFMEDYKTAYCLERTDYLNQVFSDDALIIVGHVLKTFERTNDKDKISYRNNKLVKRTQYTKDQYIKHLQACFARNECINIHFADNDITKAGKGGETFGIQIKQDYYSTTYGDSGWLFLVVDFNNPAEPTILVRVWQEEPDPEFGLANLNKLQ